MPDASGDNASWDNASGDNASWDNASWDNGSRCHYVHDRLERYPVGRDAVLATGTSTRTTSPRVVSCAWS